MKKKHFRTAAEYRRVAVHLGLSLYSATSLSATTLIDVETHASFPISSKVTLKVEAVNNGLEVAFTEAPIKAIQDTELCGIFVSIAKKAGNSWAAAAASPSQPLYVALRREETAVLERRIFFVQTRGVDFPKQDVYHPVLIFKGVIDGQCIGQIHAHGPAGSLNEALSQVK